MTVAIVDVRGEDRKHDVSGSIGSILQDRLVAFSYLHSDPARLRDELLQHSGDRTLEYLFEKPLDGVDMSAVQPLLDKLFTSMVCFFRIRV